MKKCKFQVPQKTKRGKLPPNYVSLFLVSLLFHASVLAQQTTQAEEALIKASLCRVEGIVTDSQREPLPGAHIIAEGEKYGGSTTSVEGKYMLVLKTGKEHTLIVSYLGMKAQTIKVNLPKGQTIYKMRSIVMQEDNETLDEVVVTGYQTMSKRELASAIVSVKAEDVITPNAMSIDQMLQGKIPGMTVMMQSGEPSSTPNIRIRGNSTINGSKAPIWVVDGVIMSDPVPFTASDINSPDAAYLIGNGIAGISPQDIESINVLKDASATAIYGVKAANGVIVITTKRGKSGRPIVTYDATMNINVRPTYGDYDLMNSQERVQFSQDIYDARLQYPRIPMSESYEGALRKLFNKQISQEEFGQLVRKYETMNTNWFKELFRTAVSQNHNISVNGGTGNVRYYTSLSYNNTPGIAMKSKSERFTGLGKLYVKINKIFDAELKLDMSTSTNNGYSSGVNPYNYAYNTSRAFSPYDEDGDYYYYNRENTQEPLYYNIFNELEQTGQKNTTNKFGGVFNLNAHILKGLTYTGTVSYYRSDSRLTEWATDRSYDVAYKRQYAYGAYNSEDNKFQLSELPQGGTYRTNHNSNRSYTVRNTLNYLERFNDKHDVNILAGVEIRSDKYQGFGTYNYGWDPLYGQSFSPVYTEKYINLVKAGRFNPTIIDKITQVASFFGSASYTYRDRYVFNANVRSDGSNKFGSNPEYRWLPTWSFAGKWIISNESFMRKIHWIDHLSVRASYGIQGNIHEDATPNLIARMGKIDEFSGIRIGSIYRLPNPDLRWEKTRSYNIGIDAQLLDGRLNFTFDYYHKRTSDLITDMRVSPVTGRTYITMNSGRAINKGLEGSVSADLIRSRNWDWNLSFNFSHNTNEIQYAHDATLSGVELYASMVAGTVASVGQPLGTIYSFKFEGLNHDTGYPTFLTTDNRRVYQGDYQAMVLVPSGSIYPDLSGGFDTRITFKKNLTLSIGFSYQFGAVKRLPSIYRENTKAFNPEYNVTREFINRWKKPGDEIYTHIPAIYDDNVSNGFPDEMLGLYDMEGNYCDVNMANMYDQSDIRVAKSDFLRLRSLVLSYRVPDKWLNKASISNLTLRLQANNLKTWASKEWKGLDPEYATSANMPLMSSYSIGASIMF